jgi:hypothetical protein
MFVNFVENNKKFEREASTCVKNEIFGRLMSRFCVRGTNPNCKIIRFLFERCVKRYIPARPPVVPTNRYIFSSIAHALRGDSYGWLTIFATCYAMLNNSKIVLYA